jgi:hypothetical protein
MSALALMTTGSQRWLSYRKSNPDVLMVQTSEVHQKAYGMRSIGRLDFQYTPWSLERRGGEQSCASTREGGRYQVGCKSTKKKGRAPIEAEGTVNDA